MADYFSSYTGVKIDEAIEKIIDNNVGYTGYFLETDGHGGSKWSQLPIVTINGETGNFLTGNGIAVETIGGYETIVNKGVLSFGGKTGDITIGGGLSMVGNMLQVSLPEIYTAGDGIQITLLHEINILVYPGLEFDVGTNRLKLSPANSTYIGGVKPDNVTTEVDEVGVISCKTATNSTVGVMKPDGVTCSVNEQGQLTVIGGGGGSPLKRHTQTITGWEVVEFSIGPDETCLGVHKRLTPQEKGFFNVNQDIHLTFDLELNSGLEHDVNCEIDNFYEGYIATGDHIRKSFVWANSSSIGFQGGVGVLEIESANLTGDMDIYYAFNFSTTESDYIYNASLKCIGWGSIE